MRIYRCELVVGHSNSEDIECLSTMWRYLKNTRAFDVLILTPKPSCDTATRTERVFLEIVAVLQWRLGSELNGIEV